MNTTSTDMISRIDAFLIIQGVLNDLDMLDLETFKRQKGLFLCLAALFVHDRERITRCLEQADMLMPRPIAQGIIDAFTDILEQD